MTCQLGYSPTNLSCLAPGTQSGMQSEKQPWSTYLSFYKRSATMVFSRSLFTMQEVSDLSAPIPQNITATSLFQALNEMLYRPNQTTNDFRYDRNSQPYALTRMIATDLWQNLRQSLNGTSYTADLMKNLLTMPIVMFQSTVVGLGDTSTVPVDWDGTKPQQGLAPDNYIRGSYCESSKRAIPGQETVISYAAIAGLVVLCVLFVKWRACYWERPDATEYPLLDYEMTIGLVDGNDKSVSLRDHVKIAGGQYDDGSVLRAMQSLSVRYSGA